MPYLSHKNADLKYAIISLLLKLQEADEHSSSSEFTYIAQVAKAFKMDIEEIVYVKEHPAKFKLSPPATEKDRMTILYYLLFFMQIDGKISPEEEQLVQEFGFRLGFRKALTSDLIGIVRHHADSRIPPAKMLNAIRKYLN